MNNLPKLGRNLYQYQIRCNFAENEFQNASTCQSPKIFVFNYFSLQAGATLRERVGPLMELRKQAERRSSLPVGNFEPFENCHMTHVVEIIQKKEGGKVLGIIKKVFQKKKGKQTSNPQQ